MAPYTGNSIVDYLGSTGQASDFGSRTNLAKKYNIANYTGTADQNLSLLNSLRGSSANPSGTGMTSSSTIKPAASTLTGGMSMADGSNRMSMAPTAPALTGGMSMAPKPTSPALSSPAAQTYVGNKQSGNTVVGGANNIGTGTQSGTTGTTAGGATGTSSGSYMSPDRQAYIDAYKKYMEAQTNNADVAAAKSAYNDFVTNQAKSIAGQEGRGLGVPLSLVRGTQAKLKAQTDPEATRLQNAIGIAQGGQTNMVNAMKSGVDLQKNLLDFGTADKASLLAEQKALREANPAFTLNEGDIRYGLNPKTGQMEVIGRGGAKTSATAKAPKGTITSGALSYTPQDFEDDSVALENSRGEDDFVDPTIYLDIYKQWVKEGGIAKDFLATYPPKLYVNPANTWLPKQIMPKSNDYSGM